MKREALLAAVSVTTVALAACAGPRTPPPAAAAVSPPGGWREASSPDAAIDPRWWSAFSDPALTAVVEQALAHNTDAAIAAGRVEEARAQFRLAEAQRLPNLSGLVAGVRDREVSAFGAPLEQTKGQAQLQASYDLDLFGRLASVSAAARETLLATEAARDNVRLAVATSAASGYITLRGLDARLAVLQETVAERQAGPSG